MTTENIEGARFRDIAGLVWGVLDRARVYGHKDDGTFAEWHTPCYGLGTVAINEALRCADWRHKLDLVKGLFRLAQRTDNEAELDQKRVFGPEYDPKAGRINLVTINYPNNQFRLWNGWPAVIKGDHVDSCGENIIAHIGVRGKDIDYNIDKMRGIVDNVLPAGEFELSELRNGVKIYLPKHLAHLGDKLRDPAIADQYGEIRPRMLGIKLNE